MLSSSSLTCNATVNIVPARVEKGGRGGKWLGTAGPMKDKHLKMLLEGGRNMNFLCTHIRMLGLTPGQTPTLKQMSSQLHVSLVTL